MLNEGFDILHPIDSSKQIIKDWWATVVKIRDTPLKTNDPATIQWRNDLLNRAYTLREMIKGAVSESAAQDMGLGSVPIIAGVALVAIIGYVTTYMIDAKKYFANLEFQNKVYADQTAKGVPPAQAAQTAVDAANQSGVGPEKKFLGFPLKYWLIGGGVLAAIAIFSTRRGNASQAPTIIMSPPK